MSILRVHEHPYKHLFCQENEQENTSANASPYGKTPMEILVALKVPIADASVLIAVFARMQAEVRNRRIEKLCKERGITREEWDAEI